MIHSRSIRSILALAVAAATVACLDDSITGTRPLSISLEANPATVGTTEPVTFSFVATGTNIVAVILDFGDGTADTLTYQGAAVEVADEGVHSYDVAGSYVAEGTVVASQGRRTDEAVVTVN